MRPFSATRRARSTFHCSAASPMSSSRADAPARRSCVAICGVVRLPKVPASNGVSSVSPITSRIDSDRRAQLLGDVLGERRADVLAELDLAGVDGDLPLLVDVEPGADLIGALRRSHRFEPSCSNASTCAEPRRDEDDRRARRRPRLRNSRRRRHERRSVRCDLTARLDRGDDPRVRAAAADVAVHARARCRRRVGVGVRLEQRDAGHDHPRRAVAALHRVLVDERLLERMQPAAALEPLDRR